MVQSLCFRMLDNTEVACKRLMMSERCKLGLLKVRRILRLQLFLMTSRHCLLFIVRLRRCARHRDIKSPSNGNSTFIYFLILIQSLCRKKFLELQSLLFQRRSRYKSNILHLPQMGDQSGYRSTRGQTVLSDNAGIVVVSHVYNFSPSH